MRSTKGFTLIELIIAIVILSLCILGIAGVYQTVLVKGVRAKIIDTSIGLLEEKMDEVLGEGYSVGGGGTGIVYSGSYTSFTDYTYEVEVHFVDPAVSFDTSDDPNDNGYKNIEVRVSHSIVGTYKANSLVTDWTGSGDW